MTINIHNYKRHDLFVDTGTNIQNRENNNYTFKDFISSIIKIHTSPPNVIRIKMIALTIAFSMPQLFFDYLNFQININRLSDTYLLVAIGQKQIFSFIFCYYIVTEDLDNIYKFPNGNKYMSMLSKIDTFWCEYYSILGVILVSYYWFINRYIDQTNIYIYYSFLF
jgi:hypothetical protein